MLEIRIVVVNEGKGVNVQLANNPKPYFQLPVHGPYRVHQQVYSEITEKWRTTWKDSYDYTNRTYCLNRCALIKKNTHLIKPVPDPEPMAA